MRFRKSSFGLFHPLVILLVLAVADTFLPAVLWAYSGIPEGPEWADPLDYENLTVGVCYYLVAYALFVTGFVVYGGSGKRVGNSEFVWTIKGRMFWFLLLGSLGLTLFSLGAEINYYGSIESWFAQKILIRWEGNLDRASSQSFWELIIWSIPFRMIFSLLVLVGFRYRYEMKAPRLLGMVFPILAFCFALSTFFRGSILLFLIGLGFVEYIRTKADRPRSRDGSGEARSRKLVIGTFLSGILLFVVYGAVRDRLSVEAWESEAPTESAAYRVLAQGSGLHGVSSIIKHYDNDASRLGGKTYFDMLLLPVPRFFYTSKPEWYGIDDITRGMGWPESTQSAVTMPGEAFANFGLWGLLLMPLKGVIFGILYKLCSRFRQPFLFLYPSVVLYMLFITNWMSFTGFANQLINFVTAILLLSIMFKKKTVSRR
jgi:oligosaccharide repeat unit polymerase